MNLGDPEKLFDTVNGDFRLCLWEKVLFLGCFGVREAGYRKLWY